MPGVTRDLACKRIFPGLVAMCRHGAPNVPVIGVTSSAWTIEQLRAELGCADITLQCTGDLAGVDLPDLLGQRPAHTPSKDAQ